ncbi:dipeptidase [Erythrobacter sp. AP23]|uniref:dipeptidase n=1 Tax=Erythrobacter sp. AP23 TaxID=499656 RepID=UPI00076CC7F3|nr:membrane dipeptidase [Erythrobacter sp. AP23]KWV93773.1 hypothetical protein ASS64_12825 [Erythrobacter sp. AP23]
MSGALQSDVREQEFGRDGGDFGTLPREVDEYSRRARELVGTSTTIDMMTLIAMQHEHAFHWMFGENGMSAATLRCFKLSGIDVLHHHLPIEGAGAYENVLAFLAAWNGFFARYGEHFARIVKPGDIAEARRQGKIGVILGVQNADHFRTADDVELLYDLGLRVSMLTYNVQNRLGSGSLERSEGGLSHFGAEVIAQMNAKGMLVDASHCNERTTRDAIEVCDGPMAITHSNCRAITDHPRTKSDDIIVSLAAKGGVFGITGIRNFVGTEPVGIGKLVDHIDHVIQLVGVEHVGIGSDAGLTGWDALPQAAHDEFRAGFPADYLSDKVDIEGFDHPLKFFDLAEALIGRGYSDADIALILGGNFERLVDSVWR